MNTTGCQGGACPCHDPDPPRCKRCETRPLTEADVFECDDLCAHCRAFVALRFCACCGWRGFVDEGGTCPMCAGGRSDGLVLMLMGEARGIIDRVMRGVAVDAQAVLPLALILGDLRAVRERPATSATTLISGAYTPRNRARIETESRPEMDQENDVRGAA